MWTPRMTERHDAAATPAASPSPAFPSSMSSLPSCPPLHPAASAPTARAAVPGTAQDAAAANTASVNTTAANAAAAKAADAGKQAALCTLLSRSFPVYAQTCQAALAQQSGMPLPELKAMAFLQEYRLLSTGHLGQLMGLSHGGVATLIDRLESAGLAMRHRHPADRRIIAIRPEPTQAARLPSPRQRMQDVIREVASRYSQEELEAIHSFLSQCGESLSRLSMDWLDQGQDSGDALPSTQGNPTRR